MINVRILAILIAFAMVLPASARDLEEAPAPFSLTPLRPDSTGVPLASTLTVPGVAGAPSVGISAAALAAGAPIRTTQVVGGALASYGGYLYPSHSVLAGYGSDLIANTDGRLFHHPSFPNHMMYWNQNESRWAYQDSRSMTGWFYVPREVYLPLPPF